MHGAFLAVSSSLGRFDSKFVRPRIFFSLWLQTAVFFGLTGIWLTDHGWICQFPSGRAPAPSKLLPKRKEIMHKMERKKWSSSFNFFFGFRRPLFPIWVCHFFAFLALISQRTIAVVDRPSLSRLYSFSCRKKKYPVVKLKKKLTVH